MIDREPITSPNFSLVGRKALVTGGSRGIGAAIVECFARHGADVAFCHHGDGPNAAELAKRLCDAGFDVDAFDCDVAEEAAVDRLALWTLDRFGRIDILVNCAGIGGGVSFNEMSVADWDRMIGVNLRGPFLVTRAFLGSMVERGYGRIINFSSQLAYKGAPLLAHYCAAKAGILGFTRALSYEVALHGVLVNSVAPGPIETQMLMGLPDDWRGTKQRELPLGRFGRADEITSSVLLLASDAGSYYVGQTLSPNGGDVML